jgi:tetratricopeptide (TPR) repeat protein
MPEILRLLPVRIGIAVVVVAMAGVGLLPLFGGPGYESSLGAGILLAFAVPITAALAVSRADLAGAPGIDVLSRAVAIGAALALAAWITTLLHGLRVGFCDLKSGTESFALGPAAGAMIGATWGAVAGELARRLRRRRLAAVLLAILGPLASIVFSVGRFFTSPMIFAYDPFVGFFSGTLYDTLIDFSGLTTYRAGSAATLVAAVVLALHLRREGGSLRPRSIGRPGVAAVGVAAALASVLANAYGSKLGHWQTSATIAAALGGRTEGARCTVVHPRAQRQEDVDRFVKDCDAHVAVLERWFGAAGPPRVTAFLFESSAQKGALMGAADTFIAKPWRREVYVQAAPYPHPVIGHELAHVLAGSFGEGPFRVAGSAGGLLPNPGLIEGVAVAAEPPEGDLLPREWARAMKDLGLLPRLDHLFTLGFLGENAGVAYTVSGAFVGWIHDRFGADVVRAWYGGKALPDLVGVSWADLEKRWHDDLGGEVLPPAARGVAKARFDRPGVFGRRCPHVVDGCRARGDQLRAAGDYQGAVAAYEELLGLDPRDDGVRELVGRTHLRERGREDEGRRELAAIADDAKVGRHVRDRALEDLGDVALGEGRGDEASARYAEVLSRTLDEDARRTLQIKMEAARDEKIRPGIVALLLGSRGRGPDRAMAMELLREEALDENADGLVWYLLARQYANAAEFEEADRRLDRALSGSIRLARVRVEAERLRTLGACALGDRAAALRFFALYAAHAEVSEARRGAARAMVARCTGAAPGDPAYDVLFGAAKAGGAVAP